MRGDIHKASVSRCYHLLRDRATGSQAITQQLLEGTRSGHKREWIQLISGHQRAGLLSKLITETDEHWQHVSYNKLISPPDHGQLIPVLLQLSQRTGNLYVGRCPIHI